MQLLTQKITDRLQDHKSCTIFEADIDRVWPLSATERQLREQRHTLIHAFAKSHGWSATIRDPGMRVVFRKLDPNETDKSPTLAKAG